MYDKAARQRLGRASDERPRGQVRCKTETVPYDSRQEGPDQGPVGPALRQTHATLHAHTVTHLTQRNQIQYRETKYTNERERCEEGRVQ